MPQPRGWSTGRHFSANTASSSRHFRKGRFRDSPGTTRSTGGRCWKSTGMPPGPGAGRTIFMMPCAAMG